MENLWEKVKAWFVKPAPATPQSQAQPEPTEPSPAQILQLKQRLQAATALIADAHKNHGTVHAVHYKEHDFLLTNAHVTNNLSLASTAFHYKGKKYFPIIKDSQFAFAEHIALNPRGLVCDAKLSVRGEQTDTSILRLVSPAQTRAMLYELSFGDDSRTRLNAVFKSVPGIQNPLQNEAILIHQLQQITQQFQLTPIPIPAHTLLARTPTSYSLAYRGNKATFVQHEAIESPNNKSTYDITFDCDNPIIPGHSGSPLADIAANGEMMVLGMITGSNHDKGSKVASAVKLSQIISGLDAVISAQTVNMASLKQACEASADKPIWLSAQPIRAITPPLHKADMQDAKTSGQQKPTPACPTR